VSADDHRYSITLGTELATAFEGACETLGVSKAEGFRRAVTLLVHAVRADQVLLVAGGTVPQVIVR
jgi:hypothetical protein